MESGRRGTPDLAAPKRTSDLELALNILAEYERLRPERERQEAQRQRDLEARYPGYEPGDTGNTVQWAYNRDTQRFMIAWVGDRPRWPGGSRSYTKKQEVAGTVQ